MDLQKIATQDVKEVAPPGWGHTKAEKEKTKPDKPKSKIGGSAAAFKRALDDGRFKGLPGDKTKKEKTASMFKLMWSMKKKGAKPHYKPGTDEKKKKYQDEEVTYKQRDKELKKSKKAMDYRHKTIHQGGDDDVNEGVSIIMAGSRKKSTYRGPTGDHRRDKEGNIEASFYKKKPAPTGEKWGDKSKRPKKPSPLAVRARRKKRREEKAAKAAGSVVQTKSGKKVNSNYEKLKAKIYAKDDARKKKAQEIEKKRNPNYGKSHGGRKYKYTSVKEGMTPMKDNNLFGNAYAGSYETLKKKIGSKKKHDKPAIKEASFKDYMAQAQAARDREKKRREDRKKADAQYSDTRKHGVRFYDKKGKGRIKSGKKIYD